MAVVAVPADFIDLAGDVGVALLLPTLRNVVRLPPPSDSLIRDRSGMVLVGADVVVVDTTSTHTLHYNDERRHEGFFVL